MKNNKPKRLLLLIIIASLIAYFGCSSESNPEPLFELTVRDSDYSMAYSYVYKITPDSIIIIFEGTIEGETPKKVYKSNLSEQTSKKLSAVLNLLPLLSLQDHYIDPLVEDGTQISFSIRIGTNPIKKIQVSNMYQKDLAILVTELNQLFPKEYIIHYSEKE